MQLLFFFFYKYNKYFATFPSNVVTDPTEQPTTAEPTTPLLTQPPKTVAGQSGKHNITSLLQKLLDGYDKRLRPNFGGRN